MSGFVDETIVHVASGKGGAGAISFRREKYIPRGGPDGGDGGKGGDVVFVVRHNLRTLSHLRGRRVFRGADGGAGKGKKRHGANGADAIIPVPPGTLIRDAETNRLIRDVGAGDEPWPFLRGGRGGRGNWYFRGPVRQAPRFAQPGEAGQRAVLRIELNLIAEAGFVGKPNVGKSTLLSVLTRARPRIASYPFTTRVPHLGVMYDEDGEVILADIPGIIKGASEGAGLGLQFLKHIARSAVLIYMTDASEDDCAATVAMLRAEVAGFSEELARKRSIVVATKLDLAGADERLRVLQERLAPEVVIGVSAVTGQGIPELRAEIIRVVRAAP